MKTSGTELASKTLNETDTGEAVNPDGGRWFSSLEAAQGTKAIVSKRKRLLYAATKRMVGDVHSKKEYPDQEG